MAGEGKGVGGRGKEQRHGGGTNGSQIKTDGPPQLNKTNFFKRLLKIWYINIPTLRTLCTYRQTAQH